MNRRSYLRSAGAALTAGLASGLAGCFGGGGDGDDGGPMTAPGTGDGGGGNDPATTRDPVPNLAVDGTQFGYESTDAGDLRVWAVVENVGDAEGAGTLVFVVTAGDETYERTQFVRLPTGESERVEAEFDLAVETFEERGGLEFRWQSG